jgi:hypothetical protein
MPKDYEVRIAGKKYRLRYRLDTRDEIEQRASGTEPRSILDIMRSGNMRDQATVVWGGVRGASPDTKVTPRGLIVEFQAHNDKGGDYYQDVVCPAYIAVAESKLMGDTDIAEWKRIIGYREPEGKDEPEAAGVPEAVRAAE